MGAKRTLRFANLYVRLRAFGLPLVWWTPKLKRVEREEVSEAVVVMPDGEPHCTLASVLESAATRYTGMTPQPKLW